MNQFQNSLIGLTASREQGAGERHSLMARSKSLDKATQDYERALKG